MNSIRSRRLSVRVKMSQKIIVPLTRQEVSVYFQSLKTWRDISITGFMLFCGLRSREAIGLQLYDVNTSEGQFRVLGKGNKERLVPMPANLLETVRKYLRLERPETDSAYLFVVLKGPKRGRPLTSGGLYKIFRIHRRVSGIYKANPHRFRHTFGADMARAGVSIPALMRLMGHAYVQTTMKYVNLFAEDIRNEFDMAMDKLRSKEVLNETKTEF
jgi:integrase